MPWKFGAMRFSPCLAQLCNRARSRALDPSASACSEHPRGLPGSRSGGGGGQGNPLPGKGICRCHLLTSCSSFCCLLMHQYFSEIVLACFSPHYHSNVYFMRLQQRQVIPVTRPGGAALPGRCQGEGQEAAGAAPSHPMDLPLLSLLPVGTGPTSCHLPSPFLPPYSCPCSFLLSPSLTVLVGAAPGRGENPTSCHPGGCSISGGNPGVRRAQGAQELAFVG